MLRRFFGNSWRLRSMVMMLMLSSFAMQPTQAQESRERFGERQLNLTTAFVRADGSAGGGGGGGDILVFDIVDAPRSGARAGGGVVPDFVLVNGVVAYGVVMLNKTSIPGVYEVLVCTEDSLNLGLMWEETQMRGQIGLGIWF